MSLLSIIIADPCGSDRFSGASCPEAVRAPSVEVFKAKLDKALTKAPWSCSSPRCEQEIGLGISWGLFQPELSYDLMVILPSKAIAFVFYKPPEICSFSRCSWRQESSTRRQLRPAWNTLVRIVSGSCNVRITKFCNSSRLFPISSWFPWLCHSCQPPEHSGFWQRQRKGIKHFTSCRLLGVFLPTE